MLYQATKYDAHRHVLFDIRIQLERNSDVMLFSIGQQFPTNL